MVFKDLMKYTERELVRLYSVFPIVAKRNGVKIQLVSIPLHMDLHPLVYLHTGLSCVL